MTNLSSCLLICYLICCSIINSTAATDPLHVIDSLKKELRYERPDSVVGDLYLQICYYYYAAELMDSSSQYGQKGLAVSNLDKYPFLKAQLLEQTAIAYEYTDIEKSIETYLLALDAYNIAGQAKYLNEESLGGASNAHITLVMLYAKSGDMTKSMEHYRLADEIVKDEHPNTKAYLYEIMAYVQSERGQFDQALQYEFKALKYYRKANSLNGIQVTTAEIGSLYLKLMQYDSSQHYLQYALDLFGDHTRDRFKVELYNHLGKVNLELNHLNIAMNFYEKAEELSEVLNLEVNNPNLVSSIYAGISDGDRRLGDYDDAIAYGEKAHRFAEQTGDLFAQQAALEGLQRAYRKKENYQKASEVLVSLLDINDNLLTQNNRKLQEELVQQYEAREKQTQIDLQLVQISRQQTRLITAIVISLLLLALSLLSWRNIQQRKRTNTQLKALDRSKSRFFANISHELRTPLTLISAPLESILSSLKGQGHREELKLAHSNSKKLLGLIDEIMDLSKLEAGKLELKEKNVKLYDLLKRIFFSYHSMAQLRDLHMDFDYQMSKELCVRLDVEKVEKVLNNLLSNAVKFSESGGIIKLKVQSIQTSLMEYKAPNIRTDTAIFLAVTDAGKGIDDSDLERIFDRFYQGEQLGQPLQGGTGIGLALAKELTELMGGELAVLSNTDTHDDKVGSTFTLTLPMVAISTLSENGENPIELVMTKGGESIDAHNNIGSKSDSSDKKKITPANERYYQPAIFNSDKPRVLIVEDNSEMSKFLLRTLSPDYRCATALDGAEALSMIQKDKFDLITSDIMMPRMDGFAFIEQLNLLEVQRHTPVIFLTARSLESDKLKGFQLGVDDYITKPFNISELKARMKNLLNNKFKREEWLEEHVGKVEKVMPLSVEQLAINKAESIVNDNLDKSSFRVGDLAREMSISERQLRRVLRKLTGLSPVDFIGEIRLQAAYQMLENRQFATVSEVCYEVGFERLPYFSWKFTERFGRNPSEMVGK